MTGRVILPILLTGLFLFIPVPAVRFALALLLLMRLWALAAERIIPRFLTVERDRNLRYALCHREFDLELRIRNNGPFPVTYLTVSDELTGIFPVGKREGALTLRPFEEALFTYRAVGDSRGHHSAGPVRLRGTGPFRLYTWEKKIDAGQTVIVYPRVYRVNLIQQRGIGGGSVKIANRLYEDVTSFQSLREYIPGDELKRINWKVSARLGKLYSMEYDSTIYFPVHIVLLLSAEAYPLTHRGELMERAIETAASLAVCFLRMGQKVSLITSGRLPGEGESPLFLPAGGGGEQSGRLLRTLAALAPHPEGLPLTELLSRGENPLRRGTKNFIIAPPPLSEEGNFLFEQKRKGRDMEYFMILGRNGSSRTLTIPGIPAHRIREYGEELIDET